jgi:hypothetical protein
LLDRIAKHISQHHDLSRYTRILMTMRGIALVSAASIVAEMGDPTRFHSSKSVSSYFGLAPNIDQSGPKTIVGGITKHGSRHMRRILGQIACVVCVRGDPHMKRWYTQIARRRGKHIAKTALSRKILVTAWAMMRDNNHYHDPDQADSSDQTLCRNKLRELEKRSQQSERSVSMWKAIQRLSTDKKLRTELGLGRILPPGSSKPSK